MGNKVNIGSDKVAYNVHVTMDYGKFRFIDGNRDVTHLTNLRKSIKNHGWYRQPILVNERFEIIEGQHRFMVCKELELPIEYIIQPGLLVTDCAPLNTGRTNWKTKEYVHLGTVSKNDYRYFEYMLQHYGFSVCVTYAAMGKSITGGGADGIVRSGNLICSTEDYNNACTVLEWLVPFREDVKNADLRGNKDSLYKALIFARNSKQISIDNLTERVHRNFFRYGRAIADLTDAIEKTEKIYNYKCKTENTVDIVSEYRMAIRKEKLA